MKVEAFGLFTTDDPIDWTFDCPICWSRIYEYPFVIGHLRGSIHNTSWGYEGVHLVFRDWLDTHYRNVVHSDLRGPEVWDVRTPPPSKWLGRFDTLLSVSTLEEVDADHPTIIRDCFLPQLKPGGRVVITFDLPGFQLSAVEDWLGRTVDRPSNALTPRNSPRIDVMGLGDEYRVGCLVLEV